MCFELATRRSVRETAKSLGVSGGVVSKTTAGAERSGLNWEQVEALADDELERRLHGAPPLLGGPLRAELMGGRPHERASRWGKRGRMIAVSGCGLGW